MDKVIKWTIIQLIARVVLAVIYMLIFVGIVVYVHDNGIKSMCERIWYGF